MTTSSEHTHAASIASKEYTVRSFTPSLHTSPATSALANASLPRPYEVCIIGAGRGIGEHIGYAYARAGAGRLILAARSEKQLEEVAAKVRRDYPSTEVHTTVCDVSSEDDVSNFATFVRRITPSLDVVVQNAGYSGQMELDVTTLDTANFHKNFEVNLYGTYYAAKHLVPLLLAKQDGAKSFVAINSMSAIVVSGPMASVPYGISKQGQARFVEMLANQKRDDGLLTCAIHPGGVKTDFAKNAPEWLWPHLNDDPGLCGAFCVWLTGSGVDGRRWLSGRFLSSKWDVTELESRKDEIVQKDLLKMSFSI